MVIGALIIKHKKRLSDVDTIQPIRENAYMQHVRPIVRGKAGARIVFGGKIGVGVVDGYSYIDHHSWDAYNESTDFDTRISPYEERFGGRPLRFFADKIYMTKENRRKLRDLGIQCMGRDLDVPPR